MMKKIYALTIIPLLAATVVWGSGLYTSTYFFDSGVPQARIETGIDNPVDGSLLKQLRFDRHAALYFQQNHLTDDSEAALKDIISAAETSRDSYVVVIGHTSGFTGENDIVPLRGWSSLWHSLGSRRPDRQKVIDEVNDRIHAVYDALTEEGINPRRIYTENRLDRDPLYTEATNKGKRLNRRVFVGLLRQATDLAPPD